MSGIQKYEKKEKKKRKTLCVCCVQGQGLWVSVEREIMTGYRVIVMSINKQQWLSMTYVVWDFTGVQIDETEGQRERWDRTSTRR